MRGNIFFLLITCLAICVLKCLNVFIFSHDFFLWRRSSRVVENLKHRFIEYETVAPVL